MNFFVLRIKESKVIVWKFRVYLGGEGECFWKYSFSCFLDEMENRYRLWDKGLIFFLDYRIEDDLRVVREVLRRR